MQTQVKEINGYTRQLEITVTGEERKKFEREAIKKVKRKAQLPGFRKGKAPEVLVRTQYAYEIANETMDLAMNALYPQAIKDLDLQVVAPGQLQDVKTENENWVMVFEVKVEPEVEIKKIKGLEVTQKVKKVTQENIDAIVEDFREKHATVMDVEDGAKVGDHVEFDMQEIDEQKLPLAGKKYSSLEMKIGDGKFEKAMEDRMIGAKAGSRIDFVKEYPQDHDVEAFRGRKEYFDLSVSKVYNKELPEINDEFATMVNDSYENMDDMLKDIREKSEKHVDDQLKQELYSELMNAVVENNPLEVPGEMVENYLDNMIEDMKRQYQNPELDDAKWRDVYRESAEKNVKWRLLRKKISEELEINVTDEEVEEKMNAMPGMTDDMKKQIKAMPFYMDNIREDITEEKVLQWLKDNAKIKIEDLDAAEKKEKSKSTQKTSAPKSKAKKETTKKASVKKTVKKVEEKKPVKKKSPAKGAKSKEQHK